MKKEVIVGLWLLAGCAISSCTAHRSAASKESTSGQTADHYDAANASISITPNNEQDGSLLQGKWEFDYFTNVATNKAILFPTGLPYLNFDVKAKRFSGNTGCNNVSGQYVQHVDNLEFKRPMTLTRMFCNSMGEKTFIQYLESTERFTITANSLQLISGSKPTMVFKRTSNK